MSNGNNWPIPQAQLQDGSNLAVNNANRLLDTANKLFKMEKPDYGACIFLSVIALEELGKGLMLSDAAENKKKITRKIWHDKFEFHKPKIKASINYIGKFVTNNDPNRKQKLQSLKKLEEYSLDILNEKMASIYLDWNAENNNWDYVEEKTKTMLRADAQRLLKHANWMISAFTKAPPYRARTTIALVKAGLVYAECNKCDFKSSDLKTIKEHSKKFRDKGHKIGFREPKSRSEGRISF